LRLWCGWLLPECYCPKHKGYENRLHAVAPSTLWEISDAHRTQDYPSQPTRVHLLEHELQSSRKQAPENLYAISFHQEGDNRHFR